MFGKEKPQNDKELFVIYDSKTQSYGEIVFAINQHDLIRQIINMFRDPAQKSNQLLTNAEDYSVYRVGGYSKKTGQVTTQNQEHIANLHDLRSVSIQEGIAST